LPPQQRVPIPVAALPGRSHRTKNEIESHPPHHADRCYSRSFLFISSFLIECLLQFNYIQFDHFQHGLATWDAFLWSGSTSRAVIFSPKINSEACFEAWAGLCNDRMLGRYICAISISGQTVRHKNNTNHSGLDIFKKTGCQYP